MARTREFDEFWPKTITIDLGKVGEVLPDSGNWILARRPPQNPERAVDLAVTGS
jgi:hypothetical protein